MRMIKITVVLPRAPKRAKRSRACKKTRSFRHTLRVQVYERIRMDAFDEAVCAHVKKALGKKTWVVASRCIGWIDTPPDRWPTYLMCKDEFFVTEHKYLKGPYRSEEMWKEFRAFTWD